MWINTMIFLFYLLRCGCFRFYFSAQKSAIITKFGIQRVNTCQITAKLFAGFICSRRQFPFLLDAFTYMCSCVRHTCIFLVKCIPILNKYLYSCVSDLFHSIHQSGCMDLHESNIKAISQHFHLGFGVTMKISRNSQEIGGMKILCKVMGSCYAEILYQCTEGPIKHGMTVKVEAI